ncbi:Rho GTPase activator Rgd1 [Pyrenophora tritici-repentis]|uniref:GTPase activating protein n=1 Tax=Pyrenophora tritici-repentis TaxID=45151 RepID=A0A2W1GKN2_9PLEO|nr:GTPase activating protein [Pyrenophora tritici-repentis]KAF7444750.1 GTPase activating protein [Pyrenophora tritici-repentis]KAF7564589.1 Rho GTPase activator (Rgd1) [Pyrenophora tritici-repentis]KAG9378990.1 GTPase activating protein [Pyrenophora tritici-repentis]KAI0589253.1 GTPase activating protein [Pyrenophora tritici-repentis]
MAAPPMMPPMESSESFNPEFNMAGTPPKEGAPALASPMEDAAPAWPEQRTGPPDAQTQQRVHDVLYSDIGVATLLNRLKASIASARDFANFLKRRGALEEEHAGSLKKLSRLTLDGVRKPDTRHESYQTQFEQVLHANERIADNGTQFGLALHAMHENLLQMANKMEANRKTWKQQGLTAENKVQDAERLAEKAKAKYDQLAEDLDRVKTGDTGAGRKFGLKGPKSAAQHEEDLQRKTQAADQDYASKVQTAQTSRKELVATTRPQAVAALLDLIKETDAALTMEMQKYASFNEKLVVNNGQVVSPQPLKGSTSQLSPSINQLIYQINNERDFDEYILSHASKAPLSKAELQYVKHPTQAPTRSHPTPPAAVSMNRQAPAQVQSQPPPFFSIPQSDANPPLSLPQVPPNLDSSQPPPSALQTQSQHAHAPLYNNSPYSPAAPEPFPQPDYPRGPVGQATAQQTSGVLYNSSQPPVNPVFGVTLEDLFRRDGSPVPMVVYQCIQAVDLYGLEVEGIYRIPGTSSHIQQLKALFDSDASQVDFRNPETFQQDVNSVAGLLKQFFRELPDPLLTREFYSKYIDAARIDDETMRRDSMHALINALPDPNYATLRALVLHLHRVQQSSEVNRMSTANLGICWAPSIMGPHKGNNMADAGLQARVVITILDNVLQIFDED